MMGTLNRPLATPVARHCPHKRNPIGANWNAIESFHRRKLSIGYWIGSRVPSALVATRSVAPPCAENSTEPSTT